MVATEKKTSVNTAEKTKTVTLDKRIAHLPDAELTPVIPKTVEEILVNYAFNPENELTAKDKDAPDYQSEYCNPKESGKMVLHIAQTAAYYNCIEGDPFLKANFLHSLKEYPNIAEEMKQLIEDTSKQLPDPKKGWVSTDPENLEVLHMLQKQSSDMLHLMLKGTRGYGREGCYVGYAMASIAFTAWATTKRAGWDKNSIHILEKMVPEIEVTEDLEYLFKRGAKKRLLDKSNVKTYQDISKHLGYEFNIGKNASAFVAWAGWYLQICCDTSDLPLERAIKVGAMEMFGITNWVTIEELFTLPNARILGVDMVRKMKLQQWKSDPAVCAGLFSGIYNELKRTAGTEGKFVNPGYFERWAYTAAQLADNAAVCAGTLCIEAGAWPDLLYRINRIWRWFNDFLDLGTDAAVGEVNNQLCGMISVAFEKETSREKVAQICIDYHDEMLDVVDDIVGDTDAHCKFPARMCARTCAFWYMWISRYNVWHKYILGCKSGMIPSHKRPKIRWELVDADYMVKVFNDLGCSCANGPVYSKFVESARRTPNLKGEYMGWLKLYTTMTAAVLGIPACYNSKCGCAVKLAEYLDGEAGGEYCGYILDTIHCSEDEKIRYVDLVMELIDSHQYSIYKFAAAGCGYYFQELKALNTGSLIQFCSLELDPKDGIE